MPVLGTGWVVAASGTSGEPVPIGLKMSLTNSDSKTEVEDGLGSVDGFTMDRSLEPIDVGNG